jgi:two-component system chemotaxis response regulator CheY
MRCLIIDDDPVCRKALAAVLGQHGRVAEAATGRHALDQVRKAIADKQPFALITLDIMMPDLDGHATLTAIRALEQQAGATPTKIFMTSALGDGRNVSAAFREQCTGYLTKPVDFAKLVDLLHEHGLIPR